MIITLLLAGLNLTSLPYILLAVLAIVIFLAILYWILTLFPPVSAYASKIVLIVGGIILLLFVLSLLGAV